jgi:hypothetical protein
VASLAGLPAERLTSLSAATFDCIINPSVTLEIGRGRPRHSGIMIETSVDTANWPIR